MGRAIHLIVGLMLAGCAAINPRTVYDVRVNYHFGGEFTHAFDQCQPSIRIGNFFDGRGEIDPRMLMHRLNLNNEPTSGGYRAQKPVIDILRNAINEALNANHVMVVDSKAPIVLAGSLTDFSFKPIADQFMSQTGTVIAKLTINLNILSASEHKILWKDTYYVRVPYHGKSWPKPEVAFQELLNKFLVQILHDDLFTRTICNA